MSLFGLNITWDWVFPLNIDSSCLLVQGELIDYIFKYIFQLCSFGFLPQQFIGWISSPYQLFIFSLSNLFILIKFQTHSTVARTVERTLILSIRIHQTVYILPCDFVHAPSLSYTYLFNQMRVS